ncbi:DNA-(apurinic or apyrimidinic site) lyase [Methanocaldococcus infernus ME]|uniref:8-oxoguanine DNA glycosylase/AP lyase n=1 Tax=Methanocaldococcus infernus (strain DSM 11812 / JCM 15783 / ME) TaxID=573063 RepID=D5VR06_METIM|nr:N-glycosylase/DNA lyase [Methanocaldococcus infernus]ADG13009.1 DNA-(apurinic or apyrimidinic site) lyase [Methanocaldococcus infernus ME]
MLIKKIEELKNSEVARIIEERIKEFKAFKDKPNEEWFKELCFCLLTANSSAELGIKIQKEIDDGFLYLSQEELEKRLRELGHRFYKKRAEYIVKARKYKDNIKDIIQNFRDEKRGREFLVKHIKGLGYKEASHFLRNVGYDNIAIIDRHILRELHDNNYIKEIPKSLSKKRYLEIEKILEDIARETRLKLSELDLYIWYLRTGKVLK